MELNVDPRRLTDLAATLDAAARAIEEELQSFSQASRVLTDAWKGEAATSYKELSSRFHTESRAQAVALGNAAASLDELAREYSSADERSAKAVPGTGVS